MSSSEISRRRLKVHVSIPADDVEMENSRREEEEEETGPTQEDEDAKNDEDEGDEGDQVKKRRV